MSDEMAAEIIANQRRLEAMMITLLGQESDLITFAEIRKERGISQDTLTRWIIEYGIRAVRVKGGGKAIRRKDYNKLP